MILSLLEVAELKKEIKKTFSLNLHFCDSCGGQSFTLEHSDEEVRKFVTAYFKAKNLQVIFSENGEHFTVQRKS